MHLPSRQTIEDKRRRDVHIGRDCADWQGTVHVTISQRYTPDWITHMKLTQHNTIFDNNPTRVYNVSRDHPLGEHLLRLLMPSIQENTYHTSLVRWTQRGRDNAIVTIVDQDI